VASVSPKPTIVIHPDSAEGNLWRKGEPGPAREMWDKQNGSKS
jgi:hypothetical protein